MATWSEDLKTITEGDGIGIINPTKPLVARTGQYYFHGRLKKVIAPPLSYNSILDIGKTLGSNPLTTPQGGVKEVTTVRKLNNRWNRRFKFVPQIHIKEAKHSELKDFKDKGEGEAKELRDFVRDLKDNIRVRSVTFDPSPQKPRLKAQQTSRKKIHNFRPASNPSNSKDPQALTSQRLISTVVQTPMPFSSRVSSSSASSISNISSASGPIRRKIKRRANEDSDSKENIEVNYSIERMRSMQFEDSPVKERAQTLSTSPKLNHAQDPLTPKQIKRSQTPVLERPVLQSPALISKTKITKKEEDEKENAELNLPVRQLDFSSPAIKFGSYAGASTDPRHERKILGERVGVENIREVGKRLTFTTPQPVRPKTNSNASASGSETPFATRIIKQLTNEKQRLIERVNDLKRTMKMQTEQFSRYKEEFSKEMEELTRAKEESIKENLEQRMKHDNLVRRYMDSKTEQEELSTQLLDAQNNLLDEKLLKSELTEKVLGLTVERERISNEKIRAQLQINELNTKMRHLHEELDHLKAARTTLRP